MNYSAWLCVILSVIALTSSAHIRLRRQWHDQFGPWQMRPFQVAANDDFGFSFPNEDRPNGIFPNNNFNNIPDPNNFMVPWRPEINRNPERTTTTPRTTVTSTTTSDQEISTTVRTIHFTPEGCNCPYTPQFNPVCGTDGNTYKNAGLLSCFRRCGINVLQRRMGSC